MVRFPEAISRIFHGVFVCKRCKTKRRASANKILEKKIRCKRCGGKSFRAIKKTK